MVVVMLIGLVAVIAVPSMLGARGDQLAFNYARRTSDLLHIGRARAAGRGASHLVLYTADTAFGARGAVLLFEGLDGTAAPTGPNPTASCKASGQWAYVESYAPAAAADATNRARLIDWLNANATNTAATEILADITMKGYTNTAGVLAGPVTAITVCTTPNGTTFVGTGATAKVAIEEMTASTPFTGIVEVQVERHQGSTAIGLKRRVIVAGAAAPRIKSE